MLKGVQRSGQVQDLGCGLRKKVELGGIFFVSGAPGNAFEAEFCGANWKFYYLPHSNLILKSKLRITANPKLGDLFFLFGRFRLGRFFLGAFGFFHRLFLRFSLLNAVAQRGHEIHDRFFFLLHADNLLSSDFGID